MKNNLEQQENNKVREVVSAVKKDWQLYCLLAPMVIWMLLFVYKPMGGLLLAFKDYDPSKGVGGSDWAGLFYFKQLTMSSSFARDFWESFRNTFVISMYGLVFAFPIPIILAVFMSEVNNERFRKFSQTIAYLPHFLSEITITGIVITILYTGPNYTGILAEALDKLGLYSKSNPVMIMENPDFFRPVYIITGIWKESGYNSIVYFAAVMGISPALYEALKIDGGNKMQEIRYVTFPGMAPTLIITFILRIGRILSIGYERIILLENSQTYHQAEVISTYIWKMGIDGPNKSLAGAAEFFNSLIGFILVIGANMISKKVSNTSLW